MIDRKQTLIPFRLIPRRIRPSDPPHLSTVARWALRGVGTPPVKLETVVIGGRRYTTAAALEAFVRATTGRPDNDPARASRARRTAVRRAEAELDADGIC